MTAAVVLGALHALEPGHAKTMIASFIVATRGTVRQAVLLGLSAAVSHSLLVWALALAGLYFSNSFIGDDAEPWMQLGSGTLIVAIGLVMVWRQLGSTAVSNHQDKVGPQGGRLVRTGHGHVEVTVFEDGVPPQFRLLFYDPSLHPCAVPAAGTATLQTVRPNGTVQLFRFAQSERYLRSVGDIPEPHEFKAVLSLFDGDTVRRYELEFVEHDHHDHGHDHAAQDDHAKAHQRQYTRWIGDRSVSSGEVVLFGLSSGLMPCPAALTMLLVCLRLKKLALGLGVVTAFGLGLAITLVLLGVIASITISYASRRLSWFGNAMTALPYVSSAIVVGLGVFTAQSGFMRLT
jgi:nickel/cobalt exporter